MRLEGKIIIITGGGQGLGRSVGCIAARDGALVIICSRNEAKLRKTCRTIKQQGGLCEYAVVDVTDRAEVERFIGRTMRIHGRIDVLVNNAGWADVPTPLEKVTDRTYTRYFETNVNSVFYFLRKVLPLMKRQGSGIIINISSGAGKRAHPLLPIYSATKFAVEGLTQAVGKALDDASSNVLCVAVAPGGMHTAMRAKLFGERDAARQQDSLRVAEIILEIIAEKRLVPNGGTIEIRNGVTTGVRPAP